MLEVHGRIVMSGQHEEKRRPRPIADRACGACVVATTISQLARCGSQQQAHARFLSRPPRIRSPVRCLKPSQLRCARLPHSSVSRLFLLEATSVKLSERQIHSCRHQRPSAHGRELHERSAQTKRIFARRSLSLVCSQPRRLQSADPQPHVREAARDHIRPDFLQLNQYIRIPQWK